MNYREGDERFYGIFGAKNDSSVYIELAYSAGSPAIPNDGSGRCPKLLITSLKLMIDNR